MQISATISATVLRSLFTELGFYSLVDILSISSGFDNVKRFLHLISFSDRPKGVTWNTKDSLSIPHKLVGRLKTGLIL